MQARGTGSAAERILVSRELVGIQKQRIDAMRNRLAKTDWVGPYSVFKRPASREAAIEFARKVEAEAFSVKIHDIDGNRHVFTYGMGQFGPKAFEVGVTFDGSSLKGLQTIDRSDLYVRLVPETGHLDPFVDKPTVAFDGQIVSEGAVYEKDSLAVAQRAAAYLASEGIADTGFFSPETEHFVVDQIGWGISPQESFYQIDSPEGHWNSGTGSGYPIGRKKGYAPDQPYDTLVSYRNLVTDFAALMGISIEKHHHEVATGGQVEINMKYRPLVETATNLAMFKVLVWNTAHRLGQAATFIPKLYYDDNGSGMHVHQSLWKGEQPVFAGSVYAGLSEEARWYIGGLLRHAASLMAITNRTVNSYVRLSPEFEAPIYAVYGVNNRSAAVRVPSFSEPNEARMEFRATDATGNPYFVFAAMLMAGLDGIKNKIDPGKPVEQNVYELTPRKIAAQGIQMLPTSLDQATDALERDQDYLLAGDVFNRPILDQIIADNRAQTSRHRISVTPLQVADYFGV